MTTPVLDALHFEAPPVNPTAFGLFAVTTWQAEGENRFLHGVEVRGPNYGGENSSGVWAAGWCADPESIDPEDAKVGERPDILDPFSPITVWAADECDPSPPSRAEITDRAQQILRLEEQPMVEREFAERLKADAAALPGPAATASDLRAALSYIEGALALTNTTGFVHLGAQWAAQAEPGLVTRSGAKWTTPLGHTLVFGGGYVEGLDDQIIVTSQPFGWRGSPVVRTALDAFANTFVAVAERSFVIGYESIIAAVTIT